MKQDNKFWKGLFAGVGIAAVMFSVVLFIFGAYMLDSQNEDKPKQEVTENTSQEDDQSETMDWDKIEQKMENLQEVIDYYYLGEINQEDIEQGIYKGMMASLGDPYTSYYTPEEYDRFMESSEGVYYGIGVMVSQNVSTGIITIVKSFANGPGYEAGLLPGDVLYKVGDREVTGEDLSEVVTWIKGEEGSTVDVSVVREGDTDYRSFTVERRQIEVPTIEYEMMDNQIGYIYVLEFDEVTGKQFRSAISDLEKQGMKGLVVDVRDNPGGLLHIVEDMLDRILPEGLIVYTEDKYGTREEKVSTGEEKLEIPLVVLVNGNSASAAEIFAGAVQDYGIGTLVGTTTFGKGIVQSLLPVGDGSAVKITISKYYTPKGRNIHGTGISPDVEVELEDSLKKKAVIEKSEDNQLQRGIEELMKKIK